MILADLSNSKLLIFYREQHLALLKAQLLSNKYMSQTYSLIHGKFSSIGHISVVC